MQRATKQELLDMINEVEVEIQIVKDRISNSTNDYFYDERKDKKELSELQNELYQLEKEVA